MTELREDRVIRWMRGHPERDLNVVIYAVQQIEAIARTLRWTGGRILDGYYADELIEEADALEHDHFDLDDVCCPLCEEMTCDTDCPLASLRPTG